MPRMAPARCTGGHCAGWEARTRRLVMTGSESRLYLLMLDQSAGTLSMDDAFHDADGKPDSTSPIGTGRTDGRAPSFRMVWCSRSSLTTPDTSPCTVALGQS